jgi:hypothetical protein
MNTRIALVSFFSLVSFAIGGCSADAPEGPVSAPSASNGTRTPTGEPGNGDIAAQESAPAGGDTAQPAGSEGKGAPGEGTATPPGEKQPTQADAACVASCNSGLKTKCQGDEFFCEDVCITMTAEELSCLSSAPTCDKPEWIRCMPEENSEGSK